MINKKKKKVVFYSDVKPVSLSLFRITTFQGGGKQVSRRKINSTVAGSGINYDNQSNSKHFWTEFYCRSIQSCMR